MKHKPFADYALADWQARIVTALTGDDQPAKDRARRAALRLLSSNECEFDYADSAAAALSAYLIDARQKNDGASPPDVEAVIGRILQIRPETDRKFWNGFDPTGLAIEIRRTHRNDDAFRYFDPQSGTIVEDLTGFPTPDDDIPF